MRSICQHCVKACPFQSIHNSQAYTYITFRFVDKHSTILIQNPPNMIRRLLRLQPTAYVAHSRPLHIHNGIRQHSHDDKTATASSGSTTTERQRALMARSLPKRAPLAGVQHIVVVASGKGGVGKSTTAC